MGKEHQKEVKRELLKKKKTSIEEKMAKLREKLDKEEGKVESLKTSGGGLLNQKILDRVMAD